MIWAVESRIETLLHDVGNMLTIAQANVEGMLDGVVEPTLDRLEGIRNALASASERLQELAVLRKQQL